MSDAPPLLSVVVPFYNVEAYIEECLDSLKDQVLHDIEVILVDDGSLDGSLTIAERYVDRDPRFSLVRQENQGLGPARNTGVRHATGTYLTFLDSDDLVDPRGYQALVTSLQDSGSAFAGGNAYRFSTGRDAYQSWTHRTPFAQTRIGVSLTDFPALIGDRMVWNKVYRRSFWDEGGYQFPAIRYEDYPVTLRAYLEAPAVDVLHQHVYFWRDRPSGDSITQQASDMDNAAERCVSARMVLDMLAEHDTTDEVRACVHAYFVRVDLVSLAQSMAAAAPQFQREARARGFDLAAQLDPAAARNTPRLAQVIHWALLRRDHRTAETLAGWRTERDLKALLRHLRRDGGLIALTRGTSTVVLRRFAQNLLRTRPAK